MAFLPSVLRTLSGLLMLLACAEALKFDIEAFTRGDAKGTRCIRNFVAKDTLVVVTATVDGYKGDGMIVNMHVSLRIFPVSQERLVLTILFTDQRCSWKRVWPAKRCSWRAKDGVHISC
jgi:hypothetical protein